jgi:type I restriction enzyme S subunit
LPIKSEQRKIIRIINKAERRIKEQQKYFSKLVDIKQGLMQDLLTGKVRVKV